MNELIKVDSDGKTTAKELYEFLELNPAHYARWAVKNIVTNKFAVENEDFIPFTINGERGAQATIDYKLTTDFAKKLCMVSKSSRGEQARNYFIEVEKRYKESNNQQFPLSIEDLIIMQAQSMKELKAQVNEIASTVHMLQQAQSKKAEITSSLPPANEKSIRASINQLVRSWSGRNKISFQDSFNTLYREFYYRYSIDLKTRAKNRNITPLDAAEENNCLKELLSLAVNLFA